MEELIKIATSILSSWFVYDAFSMNSSVNSSSLWYILTTMLLQFQHICFQMSSFVTFNPASVTNQSLADPIICFGPTRTVPARDLIAASLSLKCLAKEPYGGLVVFVANWSEPKGHDCSLNDVKADAFDGKWLLIDAMRAGRLDCCMHFCNFLHKLTFVVFLAEVLDQLTVDLHHGGTLFLIERLHKSFYQVYSVPFHLFDSGLSTALVPRCNDSAVTTDYWPTCWLTWIEVYWPCTLPEYRLLYVLIWHDNSYLSILQSKTDIFVVARCCRSNPQIFKPAKLNCYTDCSLIFMKETSKEQISARS